MVEITDLALAAYYYMKKKQIIEVKVNPRNKSQKIFVFGITPEEHAVLSLEFANSEFRAYDDAQRILKKLIH